ncbi:hypothetical protein WJX81_001394 [Elliptochloris bilobata]|uniref:DEAD/DEAH box helicase n=1 Tax=Elliptochloris bilobata TaxID=381761 RepID=A0AAW1R2W6_9CHLO
MTHRCTVRDDVNEADQNALFTELNLALQSEDYAKAARIRDALRRSSREGEDPALLDWHSYDIPEWLCQRAEQLGWRYPTEVQRRAAAVLRTGADAIVQAGTGSGKTLAYLLPLLARLTYPPETYPDDLQGPQLVIIVPTRELGVQTIMLVYKLFGGSVTQGVPGDPSNMFAYSGPRGLKVRGVLDGAEVAAARGGGWLRGDHVVVGTPECLGAAAAPPGGFPVWAGARAVAVDEADACLQAHPAEMASLLTAACQAAAGPAASSSPDETPVIGKHADGPCKPQLVLLGATMPPEAALEEAVHEGWLRDPVSLAVGAPGRPPAGLRHRLMVVGGNPLAALARQLRADLTDAGEDAAPARVIVFTDSEAAAREAAGPLRAALWADHTLSVLLPGGEEPIQALHAFRDARASFLLATPAAARGLDLPAVSHVYSLGPPATPADYLHRAGRAGRIGAPRPGTVTTLAAPDQADAVRQMAAGLGLQLAELAEPRAPDLAQGDGGEPADVDAAKRGLEDLFNLF